MIKVEYDIDNHYIYEKVENYEINIVIAISGNKNYELLYNQKFNCKNKEYMNNKFLSKLDINIIKYDDKYIDGMKILCKCDSGLNMDSCIRYNNLLITSENIYINPKYCIDDKSFYKIIKFYLKEDISEIRLIYKRTVCYDDWEEVKQTRNFLFYKNNNVDGKKLYLHYNYLSDDDDICYKFDNKTFVMFLKDLFDNYDLDKYELNSYVKNDNIYIQKLTPIKNYDEYYELYQIFNIISNGTELTQKIWSKITGDVWRRKT